MNLSGFPIKSIKFLMFYLALTYLLSWPIVGLAEQKPILISETKGLIESEYSEATGKVNVVSLNGNCHQLEFNVDFTTVGESYNLGSVALFNTGLIHT